MSASFNINVNVVIALVNGRLYLVQQAPLRSQLASPVKPTLAPTAYGRANYSPRNVCGTHGSTLLNVIAIEPTARTMRLV